jgi:hypothetical protein
MNATSPAAGVGVGPPPIRNFVRASSDQEASDEYEAEAEEEEDAFWDEWVRLASEVEARHDSAVERRWCGYRRRNRRLAIQTRLLRRGSSDCGVPRRDEGGGRASRRMRVSAVRRRFRTNLVSTLAKAARGHLPRARMLR